VLKLRSQRQLSASSISGISNMVAASVEGLKPESVVILDSFGRPLARPQADGDDPLGAAQLDRQQRLERDLTTKVIALLEPVVGAERVRVNVALKLNPRTSEETEERYDPNTVIRSFQRTSDIANTGGTIGNVAGVRSNLPPQPTDPKTPQATLPGAGTARSAETTNYEVSKTTRRTLQPPGDVARLSVAVILDDDHVQKKQEDGSVTTVRQARKPEELQKIQGLVAAAVGLDTERGDHLTVENVAFDEPEVDTETPTSIFVRYAPQISEFGRLMTVLLVGLAAYFLVARPLLRANGIRARAPEPEPVIEVKAPRTVADLESEIEAQMDKQALEKASENRRLPVLTRRVSAVTKKDPDHVAKLLRGWMREAER
jgi:flagellar M-ring protein FliF